MPNNNEKIQQVIERICATGCERVNEVIEIMERLENIEETQKLNSQETEFVLLELKAIMAVYEKE